MSRNLISIDKGGGGDSENYQPVLESHLHHKLSKYYCQVVMPRWGMICFDKQAYKHQKVKK